MRVTAIGIPWYRREDYDGLRTMFVDGHQLPETYDEWLEKARAVFDRVVTGGQVAYEALIEPAPFLAWCREAGLKPDSEGRIAYATEFAARRHVVV